VPMTERKTIKGEEGHIVAKISKSKDKVVILKSSKINVLFDGKRVKMEGSNLLKNKLCGLCGDSNNKKVGDVPSPRQCLLSSPKLEVASYRVSLPSKQCRPLPSHLRAELKRETERCVKLSSKPTRGLPSVHSESHSSSGRGLSGCPNPRPVFCFELWQPVCGADGRTYKNRCFCEERCEKEVACVGKCPCRTSSIRSESLSGSGECMEHRHELVDVVDKFCFSKIPLLECGPACPSVGRRDKRISFTCMSKSSRTAQHIADKVRRGEVVPELKNLPTTYSMVMYMPVECKPNSSYGTGSSFGGSSSGSSSGSFGNSLF